jgi:hypothetical protein
MVLYRETVEWDIVASKRQEYEAENGAAKLQQQSAALQASASSFQPQPESMLLRLPAEIRQMIWPLVVGGNDITLLRKVNKVAHCVWPRDQLFFNSPPTQFIKGVISDVEVYSNSLKKAGDVTSLVNLLGPLLTCKQL